MRIMTTTINTNTLRRYIPLIVMALVVGTCIVIPLSIIGQGFIPTDDALRHVAKAISGKAWQDIIIMRPGITTDHSIGWHVILRSLYTFTGLSKDSLTVFSVVSLFFLFAVSALPWTRRPEAWLLSFLVVNLASNIFVFRLSLGRPLIFSMSSLIMILAMWTEHRPFNYIARLIFTTLLIMLSTWIHGSWYLFILPAIAFFLSGRKHDAISITTCWITGSIMGACLTGEPLRYLFEQVFHAKSALGQSLPPKLLVSEFQPCAGEYQILTIIALILVWKTARGKKNMIMNDPIFIMLTLAWILGLRVTRSWIDWGVPALMLWMCREFTDAFREHMQNTSFRRLAATALICLVMFISTTSDLNGRWTDNLSSIPLLTAEESEIKPFMPAPGGTIYSPHMQIFYRSFYRFPNEDWRYMVAFEPTLMPLEDFQTYLTIWLHGCSSETAMPWMEKMKPEDRFIILTQDKPGIPELVWHQLVPGTWIGQLPAK